MNACQMIQETVAVLENVRLARDTYRLRFHCPSMAEQIQPGQFLMLRAPDRSDPLLGRAFALYDVVKEQGKPVAVDIVYLVIGKMTMLMSHLKANDTIDIWGPLGHPFPSYQGVEHLLMVAGGIGQTPFLSLAKRALGVAGYGNQPAKQELKQVSLCYGVRTKELLACVEDFQNAGVEVHLSSDDGSCGYHGYVTDLVTQRMQTMNKGQGIYWVGCGPEAMMQALAQLAKDNHIPCHVSLETPMACGVGVCFSCVTKVEEGSEWDYHRVCVEGPVFDATKIIW